MFVGITICKVVYLFAPEVHGQILLQMAIFATIG